MNGDSYKKSLSVLLNAAAEGLAWKFVKEAGLEETGVIPLPERQKV